jgi:hypothetical protein
MGKFLSKVLHIHLQLGSWKVPMSQIVRILLANPPMRALGPDPRGSRERAEEVYLHVKAKVHHDLLRMEFLAIYLTWFLAIYLTAIDPGILVHFGLFTFWSNIPEFGIVDLWTWLAITAFSAFLATVNTVATALVLKFIPIRSTLGEVIDWLMEERKFKW